MYSKFSQIPIKPQSSFSDKVKQSVLVKIQKFFLDNATDMKPKHAELLSNKLLDMAIKEEIKKADNCQQQVFLSDESKIDGLFGEVKRIVFSLYERKDAEGNELEKLLTELVENQDSSNLSESDLEDVYQVLDSLDFEGSPKQVKWARDIALKNVDAIAFLKIEINQIPISAKWWIDNRNDIYSALQSI